MPTRPAALALLACLPLAATAQAMQTVPITDVGGFAQPVKAATAEIPAGWRSQGGVFWHHATNCVSNKVRFEWQARSRDDLQGFEIMPGYSWQVRGTQIQMNPCPVQGFRSARDFLEAVVQQRRGAVRCRSCNTAGAPIWPRHAAPRRGRWRIQRCAGASTPASC